MLSFINFGLIVIIIVVIVANFVVAKAERKKVYDKLELIESQIQALDKNPHLLSLQEFNALDPTVKDVYYKYMVNDLFPKIMEASSRIIQEQGIVGEMEQQGKVLSQITAADIYNFLNPEPM